MNEIDLDKTGFYFTKLVNIFTILIIRNVKCGIFQTHLIDEQHPCDFVKLYLLVLPKNKDNIKNSPYTTTRTRRRVATS